MTIPMTPPACHRDRHVALLLTMAGMDDLMLQAGTPVAPLNIVILLTFWENPLS